MALELLHYSPEPRVIEQLIESAVMLGQDDGALFYLVRYRAAFPKEHARWAKENVALDQLLPKRQLHEKTTQRVIRADF